MKKHIPITILVLTLLVYAQEPDQVYNLKRQITALERQNAILIVQRNNLADALSDLNNSLSSDQTDIIQAVNQRLSNNGFPEYERSLIPPIEAPLESATQDELFDE